MKSTPSAVWTIVLGSENGIISGWTRPGIILLFNPGPLVHTAEFCLSDFILSSVQSIKSNKLSEHNPYRIKYIPASRK